MEKKKKYSFWSCPECCKFARIFSTTFYLPPLSWLVVGGCGDFPLRWRGARCCRHVGEMGEMVSELEQTVGRGGFDQSA